MPVQLMLSPERSSPRGRHFDAEVRRVATSIKAAQRSGTRDLHALVENLNAQGVASPSGGTWSYGTLWRVLRRGAELGVCMPARSVAQAGREKSPPMNRLRIKDRRPEAGFNPDTTQFHTEVSTVLAANPAGRR